jgi:hypothetical protein
MHKRGKSVNQFIINGKQFSIRLTDHASERLTERHIDLYQAIGAILSLGEDRILAYQNTKRDILLQDIKNGFAIVFAICVNTITIITLIDSVDCYCKNGTDIVNL